MFKNFKNKVRLARHPMRKMLFLCMIVLPYVRVRSLVPFGALCVQAYMRRPDTLSGCRFENVRQFRLSHV